MSMWSDHPFRMVSVLHFLSPYPGYSEALFKYSAENEGHIVVGQ